MNFIDITIRAVDKTGGSLKKTSGDMKQVGDEAKGAGDKLMKVGAQVAAIGGAFTAGYAAGTALYNMFEKLSGTVVNYDSYVKKAQDSTDAMTLSFKKQKLEADLLIQSYKDQAEATKMANETSFLNKSEKPGERERLEAAAIRTTKEQKIKSLSEINSAQLTSIGLLKQLNNTYDHGVKAAKLGDEKHQKAQSDKNAEIFKQIQIQKDAIAGYEEERTKINASLPALTKQSDLLEERAKILEEIGKKNEFAKGLNKDIIADYERMTDEMDRLNKLEERGRDIEQGKRDILAAGGRKSKNTDDAAVEAQNILRTIRLITAKNGVIEQGIKDMKETSYTIGNQTDEEKSRQEQIKAYIKLLEEAKNKNEEDLTVLRLHGHEEMAKLKVLQAQKAVKEAMAIITTGPGGNTPTIGYTPIGTGAPGIGIGGGAGPSGAVTKTGKWGNVFGGKNAYDVAHAQSSDWTSKFKPLEHKMTQAEKRAAEEDAKKNLVDAREKDNHDNLVEIAKLATAK